MYDPDFAKKLPFPFFRRQASFERMAWMDGDHPGRGAVLPSASLPAGALSGLLATSGHTAEEVMAASHAVRPLTFPLGMRGHIRVAAKLRRFTSQNVVGILRVPSTENLLLTAHLDHLGIGPPIDGDAIYNGAGDNASGCGEVLEMARALAATKRSLRRSIVALFVTGEEKGLVGSDYYAWHPTVPLESIAADINVDGGEWRWELFDLVPLGAEHSTLMRASQAADGALGLKTSPDSEPEQVYFIRSDQYSFVRRGIPSVFPESGNMDAHGHADAHRAEDDRWAKTRYHQPSDQWSESEWNGDFLAKDARAKFLIAFVVATDEERPRWNPGDLFEKLFGWNGGVRRAAGAR